MSEERAMTNLSYLEPITKQQIERLHVAGVCTTNQLLERGASAYGRMQLADQTAIDPEVLLEWVEQADLLRVEGMSRFYSRLLHRLGITSAPRLAYRNASTLLLAITASKEAATHRHIPSLYELERLIRSAKRLPKLIRH